MKIVCSFVGGAGHLIPQLPLLRELARSGHELTLVGRESAMTSVPRELFHTLAPHSDRRTKVSGDIAPLVPLNISAELAVVTNHFAGRAAQESAEAVSMVISGAALVVCDELDFGAMAAADRAGVPVVVVAVIASDALVRDELVGDAVQKLRGSYGLTGPVRLRGDAFVIPFARSMRNPAFPAPADTLWMSPDGTGAPAPNGSIIVTLGTEFNTESGDLFDRMLDAVAGLTAPAVVAIGRDLDPARFAPQPPNVRVEQFVDLGDLIPRASVVLHHGGSGLFTASALSGVPQIVFPMGADQPFTAERVDALRIGRVLDPATVTPAEIRVAIENTWEDPEIRSNVAAIRNEMLELPTPARLVPELMRLAHNV